MKVILSWMHFPVQGQRLQLQKNLAVDGLELIAENLQFTQSKKE